MRWLFHTLVTFAAVIGIGDHFGIIGFVVMGILWWFAYREEQHSEHTT